MADQETIDTLFEVVGGQISHDVCAQFLAISNNDINMAIDKWYSQGMDALKNAWNDQVFHADRYGQLDGGGPTFNIEFAPGVDHYPHSGAPSRPPSRTSHHAGGDAPLPSVENEGQEMGVIGGKPIFGPATKDHYDSSQWALVPVSRANEYIPDARPSNRKREPNGPVMLKPIPSGDYLPALLTILHSIPMFRNALLSPQISFDDYGVDDEWWKGGSGSAPRARTVQVDSDMDHEFDLDFVHETQRLMAFLDSTERAYGSVGNLQKMEAWNKPKVSTSEDGSELLHFLLRWKTAFSNLHPDMPLRGELLTVFNANGQLEESFVLDATVVHTDSAADLNLYDVLDASLFSSAAQHAYIDQISNVLILRLDSSKLEAKELNCKIPATFYADRYLQENKAVMDEIFSQMQSSKDQIREVDENIEKKKYHVSKTTGQKMEALTLLRMSMQAFEPKPDGSFQKPKDESTLAQLKRLHDSIQDKLKALEEQKTQLLKTIDSLTGRFRGPVDDGSEAQASTSEPIEDRGNATPLRYPYQLCGVSTRDGLYYVRHPDIESNDSGAMQWWQLEYTGLKSEAYIYRNREKLSDVVKKASSDNNKALLVYANDAALSCPILSPSDALQQFVNHDKLRFMEELQNDMAGEVNGFDDQTSIAQIGDWDHPNNSPPTYHADDWRQHGGTNLFGNSFETMSAAEYHAQKAKPGYSGMSSTTLTPNTEVEDGRGNSGMKEMQEVNGGMAAWGGISNASSDTVGGDAMDVVHDAQRTVNPRDVEMQDTYMRSDEPTVEHIEVKDPDMKGG
ncbi:hypothetical protein EJ04DRAFT_428786 [Polyplosphaeria fusca]|uniref:Ubiquitin interaction motif protein n=1 Tax=Polyplosphaeria fusca TaxID=682080 RepID=A0A9P4R3N3_9PLEO|nr:hypothetical protein EJ04DRAFT_428786 [Polyplosphaeria fusca]